MLTSLIVPIVAFVPFVQQKPYVRSHDRELREIDARIPAPASSTSVNLKSLSVCANAAAAWHNEAAPGGGTLSPFAFGNSASIDGAGRALFFSDVVGVTRNQGVWSATPSGGLAAIAIGCGGGGGSGNPGTGVGDPSPIGGTFSGFFGGTFFTPATNLGGDVLFIADVDGGSAPRGLFLYRRATSAIVKVAAPGDVSPAGGILAAVGPGSINDAGDVVFLANGSGGPAEQILRWSGGVLTKVAANGDAAPGGGVYTLVGGESVGFADGSNMPVGPLPDINASGSISFRALASGAVSRGIVVVIAGVPQWYVKAGDPTPVGGTFFDLVGANLSDAGEVAFFADVKLTATTFTGGWFAGKPGNLRKVLAFGDAVDGGTCNGLAFSRNPMSALGGDGSVLVWTDVSFGATSKEELLLVDSAGAKTIVARKGDATPFGGTYTALDAWPSQLALRGTFGAGTPGAPGGALNTRFVFEQCAPAPVVYCTAKVNSKGCAPTIGSTGTSSASATSGFTLTATQLLNNKSGLLIYGLAGRSVLPFAGGTLCVAPPLKRTPVGSTGGNPPPNDCSGTLSRDMNAFAAGLGGGNPSPALAQSGTTIDCQIWSRDPGFAAPNNVSLSNALEYVVGP